MTAEVNRCNVVRKLLRELKDNGTYLRLPVEDAQGLNGYHVSIRTASIYMSDIDEFIIKATKWRNTQNGVFFSEFNATEKRTYSWFQSAIQNNPDKILFIIEYKGALVGHIALRYDSAEETFEVENILRGDKECKGCMTLALSALCNWVFYFFPVRYIFLRSFVDNFRAMALYKRCGFVEVNRWPVFRKKRGKDIVWLPINPPPLSVPQRLVVKLIRSR